MIRRLSLILSLLLVLALLGGVFGSTAWADESGVHGTGLIPPTQAQAEWLQENLPVVQKIRLNQLALQRINSERQAKGLAGLSTDVIDIAPMGAEDQFSPSMAGTQSIETTADMAGVLPGAVDNSASPAFPPIGNQGGIGSCASWATTYYQMTYETNLALGRTASGGDTSVIFSPKWTYDMINGGSDAGSGFSDAYALEMQNGVGSWADFPYDTNYLSWCMNPTAWSKAISYRSQSFGQLYNTNIDTLINDIKTQLANGHVLVTATYVYSWVQTVIANDPSTAEDDAFAGQKIASYVTNTDQGSHGMTVVGYNDNLWTDLNGNGRVDPGEKGAFKIANSWGTSDWNRGYRWVAYDALRPVSNVSAAGSWPTTNRSSRGIFWPGNMFTLTVTPNNPRLKAEVTLNTGNRGQLAITLGTGSTSSATPSTTWTSKAVYYTGGNYGFSGTNTAVDGTFYFDFTDLAKSVSGAKRWFVGVADSTAGNPVTVKSFKLYQTTASGDVLVATSSNAPKTVDAGKTYVWIDYTFDPSNLPPVALIGATPATGQIPLSVNFDGSGSNDSNGQIVSYSWNFGDGSSTATGAKVSHTYSTSGLFTVTLTVTDDRGMSATNNFTINATNSPNHPPVLALIGNKTVNAGQTLSFTISATDPDGNTLTYSASNLPPGASFNASTHTFSWTPTTAGTYPNVYFQVSDGSLTDYEYISINVTNANRPPVLDPIGNKTVNAGQTLSFTISATDPDGNTLTYSAANLPPGASFNISTHTFSWTPTTASTFYNVYFQVSDGSLTDYEYISISATNANFNRPPVLALIGNKTVNAGQTLSFTISATDPDGNILTYSAANLPPGASFNISTHTFTWTPTTAGTYPNVYFQVSDGSLTDYEYISINVTNANRPPVLDPIGNKTVNAGQTLSFTISATDPDGNILTYSAANLPPGASFNISTHTFTWTPTTASTFYNVYFQVSDGSLTDYEYISIAVTNTNFNRPPVLALIGNKTVNAGQTLSFTISATDPDGNTLTYSTANLPPGASFNTSTHTFSWTPTTASTFYNVYFQVSDGSLIDYEYISINVTNANRPPVLDPIGNKTVNAGQTLSFTISATDPDGNTLAYSTANLPPGASFNISTHTFTWTPTTASTFYNVYFQVSDGSLTDYEYISIAVTNTNFNRPPVLALIGNKTVNAGQTLSFTISATDPDGNTLTYSTANLPPGASFNTSTHTFSWTPTTASTFYNVYFQVSDGSLIDYEYISINVTNANRPPVLDPIGNKTVNAGQTLSFTISATDPDGNTLTYSTANLPPGASFNTSTHTFSWTPTTASTFYNVYFQVSDGSLTDYEYISIAVTNTNFNRPPVLALIGNKTVNAGQTLSFTISATDPDGNTLTYSTANLPPGASFNTSTHTFSWTPTTASTFYNVYFQVSDGSLIDYEYISINVTNANRPPVLDPIGNKTVNAGQTLSFTISATDPDGNTLTYSTANLPPGASFNTSTHTFSWTPTTASTFYNVYFQVSDGSLTDYEYISISATNANINRPPVLDPIGNKTVNAGQTLSFTLSATDPDGNTLTYSAANLPPGASFNASTHTFSWTPTTASTFYNVFFQVSDGALTDYEYISIAVTNTNFNRPPALALIGNKTVNAGQTLSFTISATDPDGNTLTYSASNLPPGASFNTSTHTFSWTPTTASTFYNVYFQVSDGSLTDYEYISIAVNPATVVKGQVSGTVKDIATGLGISGAAVSDGFRSTITAASGAYTIANVPPGSYTISIQASGYQSTSQTVTVSGGQTATVNVNLQKPVSNTMWVESITFVPGATDLTVKVKVINPEALANAQVMISVVYNGGPVSQYFGVTGPDGVASFRFAPAGNGNYTVSVVYLAHATYKWNATQGINTGSNILSR